MKTPATEFLSKHHVSYTEHYYEYIEHGGAERGADAAHARRSQSVDQEPRAPGGTRKPLPTYMERSISELPMIYINGGRRGFLLKVRTDELVRALRPQLVDVALND